MEKRQTVILCGNSLLLVGVEACLAGRPGLDVRRVPAADLSHKQHLDALSPDVIIFEMGTGSKLALDSLKQQPGLLLIGLDLDSSQVIILSGRRRLVPQSDDLVKLIQDNVAHNAHGLSERAHDKRENTQ